MNHFARIALAAGLLAAPALPAFAQPAFAQNGTPLAGMTSPTPSAQTQPATPTTTRETASAHHVGTTTAAPKTHRTAKLTTKKPATPVSAPASPAQPAAPKAP